MLRQRPRWCLSSWARDTSLWRIDHKHGWSAPSTALESRPEGFSYEMRSKKIFTITIGRCPTHPSVCSTIASNVHSWFFFFFLASLFAHQVYWSINCLFSCGKWIVLGSILLESPAVAARSNQLSHTETLIGDALGTAIAQHTHSVKLGWCETVLVQWTGRTQIWEEDWRICSLLRTPI